MIIKVQLSLATTAGQTQALVYNRDHSFMTEGAATALVLTWMKGRDKAFFQANVVNGSVTLLREVADPGW